MRKFKYQLDRLSIEIIYTSFIRPILEYGDILFDNCTQHKKDELDNVQNEAARILTGGTEIVSINNLYKETGWESLENRRRKHKLVMLYKMINHLTPHTTLNLFRFQ